MVSLMPVEPFKTILEAYGMHDFCTGPEGAMTIPVPFRRFLKSWMMGQAMSGKKS